MFSHITCFYFTIYYVQNKLEFFQNCYKWLKPGGYLVLHLVNRNKFDPIINASNPVNFISPQKYAKKRITNSIVKFNNFTYKANFSIDKNRNVANFKEMLKYNKNGNVRENNHILFMDTQKRILTLAKNAGFVLKGKIDLVRAQYEYQYLYILQKPINFKPMYQN
jgi:SAM-dependent methyltransferase